MQKTVNKQAVLVLFLATVDEASPVLQRGGITWFLTIKRRDESNTISFQPGLLGLCRRIAQIEQSETAGGLSDIWQRGISGSVRLSRRVVIRPVLLHAKWKRESSKCSSERRATAGSFESKENFRVTKRIGITEVLHSTAVISVISLHCCGKPAAETKHVLFKLLIKYGFMLIASSTTPLMGEPAADWANGWIPSCFTSGLIL